MCLLALESIHKFRVNDHLPRCPCWTQWATEFCVRLLTFSRVSRDYLIWHDCTLASGWWGSQALSASHIFNIYTPDNRAKSETSTDRLTAQHPVFIASSLPLGSGLILQKSLCSSVYVLHRSTAISSTQPFPNNLLPPPPPSLCLSTPPQRLSSGFKIMRISRKTYPID